MLALVGWYLMVPPITESYGHVHVQGGVSISQWELKGSYDSAAECRQALLKFQRENHHAEVNTGVPHKAEIDAAFAEQPEWAQCIASDDPRLKSK
jgi:hypothetical protein